MISSSPSLGAHGRASCLPLGLVLLEDLALGMVAQDAHIGEAAQVELLGAKHRHGGRLVAGCAAARRDATVSGGKFGDAIDGGWMSDPGHVDYEIITG